MIWKGDQLQAVVFLKPGAPVNAAEAWQKIFESPPDAFQLRVAANPTISHAQGTRDGLQLNITGQVGRVDLTCLPAALGVSAEEFPQIEDVAGALKKLSAYAAKFTAGADALRVAIVLNLGSSAEQQNASAMIAEMTGAKFPANSLDPIYQFNIRRNLTAHPSVVVNRLCAWGVGEAQILTVNPQLGGSPIVVVSRDFVTLKIDVNTVINANLPPGSAHELFPELVEIAYDIANRGIEAFQ